MIHVVVISLALFLSVIKHLLYLWPQCSVLPPTPLHPTPTSVAKGNSNMGQIHLFFWSSLTPVVFSRPVNLFYTAFHSRPLSVSLPHDLAHSHLFISILNLGDLTYSLL